ncbi:hypothetical protein [Crenothrix sp.]|uniref:hypothetical protein n=1 Tax=Crenothrix sp. TaxID=3100433 RepID=UPI00374DB59C
MTLVPSNLYSPIQIVKKSSCLSKRKSTLNYEVGKNSHDVLFVRINNSNGGGSTFNKWFAICDLAQLYANGTVVVSSSLEPFDQVGNPLPQPKNNNTKAFLKAVLHDVIK